MLTHLGFWEGKPGKTIRYRTERSMKGRKGYTIKVKKTPKRGLIFSPNRQKAGSLNPFLVLHNG